MKIKNILSIVGLATLSIISFVHADQTEKIKNEAAELLIASTQMTEPTMVQPGPGMGMGMRRRGQRDPRLHFYGPGRGRRGHRGGPWRNMPPNRQPGFMPGMGIQPEVMKQIEELSKQVDDLRQRIEVLYENQNQLNDRVINLEGPSEEEVVEEKEIKK